MAVNWAPVGEQLAKQQTAGGTAFDTQLGKLVSRGAAEERLKQDLLKTTALQGVKQALLDAGYSEQDATLGAGAAQGGYGSDIASIGQAALRRQEQGFRQSAVDAATTGGVAAANPYLTGVASGPLRTTDITAGQAFNPYDLPGQGISITDVGQAAIAADRARAEQASAGAEENRAQAEKARREPAAKTGRSSNEKWSAPSQSSFNAAFQVDGPMVGKGKNAKPTKSLLQNEIARFNSWRATNDIANGEEALIRWRAAGRPGGKGPGADAGVAPQERGTVADFNAVPDEDVTVVTEVTGPRGVPMSQLGQAVAPPRAPAAAPATLPPAAIKSLKSGVNTRFGNGQVWTLTPDGQPTRVQ